MCGGFSCTKTTLTALNILYIAVSFVLIGVATYAKALSIVTNVNIIGGILGCGAFLFFLSLVGLVGTRKHNQVLLFFYMVILFILFVVQFSIAFGCLAFSDEQKEQIAREGWESSPPSTRHRAEKLFNCCGFNTPQPYCESKCCLHAPDCRCPPCSPSIQEAISSGLSISGWVGLLFSITEFFGVWLTIRYRNQKDPRLDPSAFL